MKTAKSVSNLTHCDSTTVAQWRHRGFDDEWIAKAMGLDWAEVSLVPKRHPRGRVYAPTPTEIEDWMESMRIIREYRE